jgi:predicted Fe-Mo cluster-binding NifX family protein
MHSVFEPLLQTDCNTSRNENQNSQKEKKDIMKIAIPTTNGKLSAHFGHCEEFTLVDVNEQTREIANMTKLQPPAHEPGVLPKWLGEQKADVIIAGGMGQRARQLFDQNNIKVIVGAPAQDPDRLVKSYLDDTLEIGDNVCDH